MKLKKSHIFFISYYAAAILGNVLAAVLLREQWNFNAWSAFPIGYVIFSIFMIWYFPSEHYSNLCLERSIQWIKIYRKDFDEMKYRAENNRQEDKEETEAGNKFFVRITLLCIPYFFMFICFFSNFAKFASFVFPLIVSIFSLLIWVILTNSQSGTNKH